MSIGVEAIGESAVGELVPVTTKKPRPPGPRTATATPDPVQQPEPR